MLKRFTITHCRASGCNGGMVIKRLWHPMADDGELHPTRCWSCKGTGYIDGNGNPVHLKTVHL